MASETSGDAVGEDVDWRVDEHGRYVFTEDGTTFVLATDGWAYAEDDLGDREPELATVEGADDDSDSDAATSMEQVTLGTALRQIEQEDDASPRGWRARRSRKGASAETSEIGAADDVTATVKDGADPAQPPAAPARTRPRTGRRAKGEDDGASVLLRLSELKSGYGALPVLHGVSVEVRKGETAVLLGLNGAGKTTTALNVCGALRPWSGTIEFDGQDITDWNTRRCVAAGVVMVPEGRRVFPDLTVAKNLQMGAWSQRGDADWLEEGTERVFDYFPRMRERADQLAGTLSGGEQQMLALGRGLMARPKLLIIDEASMGLAPVIVRDVFDIVSQINKDGVTVLMIEQNVGALDVADLGLVMEQGRLVKQLRGARLKDRREVADVLMG